MSKAFRAASSAGAVGLVLSGAAMAASPTGAFDAWSVSNGAITTTEVCPAGFTCATAVTGEGFFQRQITETATGNDFFQTIITDKDASGAPGGLVFSDESYVRAGNVSGLADKSYMKEVTSTGTLTETFEGSTELGTGWAKSGTSDETKIYQAIIADDIADGAEDFDMKFWLKQLGQEGADGKLMRITSNVDIQEATGTSTDFGTQEFVLVELDKGENPNPGTVSLGADGTLSWVAEDRIKSIWIGQDMSSISGVGQEFGFTAYENLTTPALVNTFSLAGSSSTAPTDWDSAVWGSPSANGPAPF